MTRRFAAELTTDRIDDLLRPLTEPTKLSDHQLNAIKTYLDLLLKWNAKLNLTAIRDPEEAVVRHFGESLFSARQLFSGVESRETAIDIGSGAGFPGLPLKLWNPSLELTLVESNHRKATFLREVVRALNLDSVSVLASRAEAVSLCAELVSFRAVEHFERMLPVAFALVKPQGSIAMLIGEAQVELAEMTLPNVEWKTPISIPGSRNRTLLIGRSSANRS